MFPCAGGRIAFFSIPSTPTVTGSISLLEHAGCFTAGKPSGYTRAADIRRMCRSSHEENCIQQFCAFSPAFPPLESMKPPALTSRFSRAILFLRSNTKKQSNSNFREKNAFVVRGRAPDYFSGWLETADIESFVSGQSMQYGVDLDVTNYVNKRRVTLNPPSPASPTMEGAQKTGRRKCPVQGTETGATAPSNGAHGAGNPETGPTAGGAIVTAKFVWEKFREGCSLRMPCPQKFSDPLHRLLAALEEEFGCMVGSNVYLTPPRSQGFAPHWDDIEAFLLQVMPFAAGGKERQGTAGQESAVPKRTTNDRSNGQNIVIRWCFAQGDAVWSAPKAVIDPRLCCSVGVAGNSPCVRRLKGTAP